MSASRFPSQCLAVASSSLCVLLPTPSGELAFAPGITPATPLLRLGPTPMPPYVLLASSACRTLARERHGAPKFRHAPFDDLPRTQTPARRHTLANCARADTGFQEMKPLPLCDVEHFGARYLHLRCGRSSPFLRLRMIRCLLIRGVPFRPGGWPLAGLLRATGAHQLLGALIPVLPIVLTIRVAWSVV